MTAFQATSYQLTGLLDAQNNGQDKCWLAGLQQLLLVRAASLIDTGSGLTKSTNSGTGPHWGKGGLDGPA